MNPLSALKDKAFQVAARAYLNQKISSFGSITGLDMDTRAKSVRLEVQLKGETTPIRIDVARYELMQENQRPMVSVRQVSASREWITTALNQYLVGRPFEIPSSIWNAL